MFLDTTGTGRIMPREITHRLIAEETVRQLPPGTLNRSCVAHAPYVLFGCIAHDVGYYWPRSEVYRAARRLHGLEGEDTYAVLRNLARQAAEDRDGEDLVALLVGLATHIIADAVFHPMVYHHAGSAFAGPSRERDLRIRTHLRFETLLDVVLAGGVAGVRRHCFAELWRAPAGLSNRASDHLASAVDAPNPRACSLGFRRGAAVFRLVHRLSLRCLGWRSWAPLRNHVRGQAGAVLCFGYSPALQGLGLELDTPVSFRNPTAGASCTSTLRRMFDEAVQRSLTLCETLTAAIDHGKIDGISNGPSLELGTHGTSVSTMRCFAPAAATRTKSIQRRLESLVGGLAARGSTHTPNRSGLA